MTQTMWLMLAIAVVAVVIGFLVGRLTAPRERQFQETRSELERVQKERDELRDSVENHFQHTAALFGNLSRDYRALYLHFAEGARSMGLGEEPAQRLIEEARASADAPADPEAATEKPPIDPEPEPAGDRARAEADDAPEAEDKTEAEAKSRPAPAKEETSEAAAGDQAEVPSKDDQTAPASAGVEGTERKAEPEAHAEKGADTEAEPAERETAEPGPRQERRAGE